MNTTNLTVLTPLTLHLFPFSKSFLAADAAKLARNREPDLLRLWTNSKTDTTVPCMVAHPGPETVLIYNYIFMYIVGMIAEEQIMTQIIRWRATSESGSYTLF